jgi:hypothetical protein
MPTTLPDVTTRSREKRRGLRLELVPLVAAIIYLAVLGWDMAALETDFSALFASPDHQGAYNPMEPTRPAADGTLHRIGWRTALMNAQ